MSGKVLTDHISSNGLSLEDREINGWFEAGVLTTSQTIIGDSKKWFEKHWDNSQSISKTALKKYKEIWKLKRKNRIFEKSTLSILDAASKCQEAFKDRDIYFAVYRENVVSEEAEAAFENAKAAHSSLAKNIDFFEAWSDLPNNAYLICIYVGPRYGATIGGIIRTHNKPLIEKFINANGDEGDITLCFKEKNILDHTLSKSDRTLIRKNIKKLFPCKQAINEAFLVPLTEGILKLKDRT